MRIKIFATLIIFSVAINLLSFKAGHEWGDDFAAYIKQSQTFTKGDFNNLKEHIGRTDYILNYPWGYPILLSPVINFFNSNINALKYYTFIYFILSLLFVFLLLKKNKEFAILTVLLISCNPFFWQFKNNILADLPNLCFTFLTLYLVDRFVVRKQGILNDYFSNFLIGLSIFLCFVIKNQSLILLPTLFILQIIIYKKSAFKLPLIKKLIIPYLTFFVFAYLLLLWVPLRSVSYPKLYTFNFIFVVKTILANIIFYLKVWNELFESIVIIAYFSKIFTSIVICFALIGVISSLKKEYALIIIFPIMFICLFLITPFHQGLRYIIPIVPLFLYFFISGVYYSSTNVSQKYGYTIYSSLVILLIAASFKFIIGASYTNYKEHKTIKGPYTDGSKEMFTYIKDSTSVEDIIEFWKPRAMLLFSNRNSIFTPNIQQYFVRKANYLVYCKYPPKGDADQIPIDTIHKYNDLSPVFTNNTFIIFKAINK